MPKNPVEVSLYQSPGRPVDNTTASAVLLDQYSRMEPMGFPRLSLLSVSRPRPDMERRWLALSSPAVFIFQAPVTVNITDNLAEVFRSSATH
jgi:hypothetical protein